MGVQPPADTRPTTRGVSLLLAMALLLTAVKFAAPLPRWLDLQTFDEAEYQGRGRTLTFVDIPTLEPEWSPLYLVWYRALAALPGTTPVTLFDRNWQILGVLLTLALWGLLRQQGVGPLTATLAAWFFLTSEAAWLNRTRVATFALVLLAVLWGTAMRQRTAARRAWVLAWGLMGMVAAARPEFFLAGVLTLALALFLMIRTRDAAPVRRPALWAWPALAFALWALWGVAFDPARVMYAFGQHYAYNRATCLHLPPRGQHWEDEVRLDFGAAASLGAALRANPAAFARHVGCNLLYTAKLGRVLLRTAWPPRALWAALLATALGLGRGLFLLLRHRPVLAARLRAWRQNHTAVLWLLIMAPLLADLWLIYSRESHYLQMVAFWLYLPVVTLLAPRRPLRLAWWQAGMLAGLMLLTTPTIAGFFRPRRQPPPLYNRATVALLEAVPWRADKEEIRLTATARVAHYFLLYYLSDPRFVEVPYAPAEGFVDYLRAREADAVIVHRPYFSGDASWEAFAEDPAAFGFVRVQVLDEKRWLFIRAEALAPDAAWPPAQWVPPR